MKLRALLLTAAVAVGTALAPIAGAVAAAAVPQSRIDAILAMTPTDMAKSGAWTTA